MLHFAFRNGTESDDNFPDEEDDEEDDDFRPMPDAPFSAANLAQRIGGIFF
jgi:hypothetical protein